MLSSESLLKPKLAMRRQDVRYRTNYTLCHSFAWELKLKTNSAEFDLRLRYFH